MVDMLMNFFNAIILALALANPGTPSEPSPKVGGGEADLSGLYECAGVSDGKEYSAFVLIVKAENNAYLVQWNLGPTTVSAGLGLRHGDIISVGYPSNGKLPSVGYFRVLGGGRLAGRFINSDGVQTSEALQYKLPLPKSKAIQ